LQTTERGRAERASDETTPTAATRLRLSQAGETRVVDVYEAYWNDLVPSLAAQSSLRLKVVRGLSLVGYWVFSRVWMGGLMRRKYLTFGVVTSAAAMIAWYLGVVGLFLEALVEEPPVFLQAVPGVVPVLDALSGWQLWAGATLFMALLPVPRLVDMIDFSKRYLTNEVTGARGVGLRVQLRHRVRQQILDAVEREEYSRLTLVGHSFGSVVAVDLLADLELPANLPLRLVTLGSPLRIFGQKAPWLYEEVDKCARRPGLESWKDVTIDSDWFATGIPLPDLAACSSRRVPAEGTFVDHLQARTHARYFDNQAAVEAIVAPWSTNP